MWVGMLEAGICNASVALVMSCAVLAITRFWRNHHVQHLLWLLVLAKLVSPPLWHVPVSLPSSIASLGIYHGHPDKAHSPPTTAEVTFGQHRQESPSQIDRRGQLPETELRTGAERSMDLHSAGERDLISLATTDLADGGQRFTPSLSWWTGSQLLASVWIGGTLLWSCILLKRLYQFDQIVRQTLPATPRIRRISRVVAARLSLRRSPDLRLTDASISPMVWPAARPIVLLPRQLVDELDCEQLSLVIAHELGHIRRGDHWIRFLELWVVSLYWWNPVAWWVRRQLHATEEVCCDALVMRAYPSSAAAYGHALLRTKQFVTTGQVPPPVLASRFTQGLSFKERVDMILANNFGKPASIKMKWILVMLAAGVLPLAARIVPAQDLAEKQGSTAASKNVKESSKDFDPTVLQASPKVKTEASSTCRVNGRQIGYEEIARECIARYGTDVLATMIDRLVIETACAEAGIVVEETEVEQEIARVSSSFGHSVEDWYRVLKAERNLTPQQYRRDVVWPALALRKLSAQEVVVTEEMLQEAYADNYGAHVRVRMILLDDLSTAQKVWGELRDNLDRFEDLVATHSVDPYSRQFGGKIPPVHRYSGTHEAIRLAAFTLSEANRLSGIIAVDSGKFAILRFEGMTQPVDQDLEEVKAQLSRAIAAREIQRIAAKKFASLKAAAQIENNFDFDTN